jgi:hypothetical protein
VSKNAEAVKNKKRHPNNESPSKVLTQEFELPQKEKNVVRNEETKIERKRVSFDLRTDLHKELKIQSVVQEKNIYLLIEEALDQYLKNK